MERALAPNRACSSSALSPKDVSPRETPPSKAAPVDQHDPKLTELNKADFSTRAPRKTASPDPRFAEVGVAQEARLGELGQVDDGHLHPCLLVVQEDWERWTHACQACNRLMM